MYDSSVPGDLRYGILSEGDVAELMPVSDEFLHTSVVEDKGLMSSAGTRGMVWVGTSGFEDL